MSPKPTQSQIALEPVGAAIDYESHQWLNDNRPDLAGAIDQAVDRGIEPIAVRRFVMRQTARIELALRCEQYARHAWRSNNDN